MNSGKIANVKKETFSVKPIGKHPLTNYPEVICPNCKRHFFWRQIDKEMHCICGVIVIVDES